MECPNIKCGRQGAYVRIVIKNGKRTDEKEVYCRLCNTATLLKKEEK